MVTPTVVAVLLGARVVTVDPAVVDPVVGVAVETVVEAADGVAS